MAGLTDQGLEIATLEDIFTDLVARLRAKFGTALPVTDATVEGQLGIIWAEALAKVYEHIEAVYSSLDPDKATGAALDAVCMLTGTVRDPASFSVSAVVLTGDNATAIPEGSQVSTGITGEILETNTDVTIATVDSWALATTYAVDDRVTNDADGTDRVFQCVTAGTAAAFGSGPSGTDTDITDGTVHWAYIGDGTGAVDANVTATETGPISVHAFSITEIVTPISGWLGVNNPVAGATGSDVETDEALRIKRATEVARPGTGTPDAIRTAIADVTGVTSVKMFRNRTAVTDADGMPPNSVEALVRGGDDQDIWDALLANVGDGIGTFGNAEGTATDSEGTVHVMAFSRPVEVPIYVTITLTYDADDYPDDGDDQVKEAIVAFGDAASTGRDAIASAIQAQAFQIDGVLKVASCFIGTSPGPATDADITIAARELATYAVARITVSSSAGTP